MDKGNIPNVIILDVPRQGKDYINYGALEQIKNGTIYSGKYEGGKCRYPYPHVFVLTNFRVDTSQWSADRMRFINTKNGIITNDQELNEEGEYDVIDTSEINYTEKYYDVVAKYKILENKNIQLEAINESLNERLKSKRL